MNLCLNYTDVENPLFPVLLMKEGKRVIPMSRLWTSTKSCQKENKEEGDESLVVLTWMFAINGSVLVLWIQYTTAGILVPVGES